MVSCVDSKPCYRFLSSHKQTVATIKIGALEHNDRVNLVRKILAEHGKQLDESAFNNQVCSYIIDPELFQIFRPRLILTNPIGK